MTNTVSLPTELTHSILINTPQLLSIHKTLPSRRSFAAALPEVLQVLRLWSPISKRQLPERIIRIFILIKVNSLFQSSARASQEQVIGLGEYFNRGDMKTISEASSDSGIMSQIIVQAKIEHLFTSEELAHFLEGNCLMASICTLTFQDARIYLTRQEIVYATAFVALGGKPIVFKSIVHEEKNHQGEIASALNLQLLTQSYPSTVVTTKKLKVQDPYSLRCGPHVNGVLYELLSAMDEFLTSLINGQHYGAIFIGDTKLPNLALSSDEASLKLEGIIWCLHEMGNMSFIRAERILNSFLTNRDASESDIIKYRHLKIFLSQASECVCQTRKLCAPLQADTVNTHDFNQDILHASGRYWPKVEALFDNLYLMMGLEVMAAVVSIDSAYPHGNCFQSPQMTNSYIELQRFSKNACTLRTMADSLRNDFKNTL